MNDDSNLSSIAKVLRTPKMARDYFNHQFFTNLKNKKVLYIHIPYCIRKCRYCVCQSTAGASRDEIIEYVRSIVISQIREYSESMESIVFDQLYMGGGTPTILSDDELDEIFQVIPNFDKIPLKCIEASPETLDDNHIDLFCKRGFSFVSIGVQSLDKSICKKQNRYNVSKEELISLSQKMLSTGVYFNYDLICFMDKGDIRDLPQFNEDLLFVMNECNPSSITIHQLQQSIFTCEKTRMLQECIKNALKKSKRGYQCVNSMLNEEDIYNDTVYQAEYRLACRDYDFSHYMWNKYAALPIKGYDILSIGFTSKVHTISNVGFIFYSPGEDKLKMVNYNSFIYDDFEQIRKAKGFGI